MTYNNLTALLILISPALFLLTTLISSFRPGRNPSPVIKMGLAAGIFSIAASVYGILTVHYFGTTDGGTGEMYGLGLTFRLDPLSILMFSMIALLSFVILKFSVNYLDGDARHGDFIGRLTATIAAAQLIVLSGNLLSLFLAWVFTSLMLHRLLIFYPERKRAVIAARKKFIAARLGDFFLFASFILLYMEFGTGNLGIIFDSVKNLSVITPQIEAAAVFMALAAIFKSAQFPAHGWLIEVMETPTPVSALLHAGLLNAGPFLMVRMAFVLSRTEYAPVILIVVGSITALIASVSFLTQPSIKTALGYSSVAHMGFMLFVSGIGVFPAVMLHLVAHSFYKAHAFLASGSAVDKIRAYKVTPAKRIGNPLRISAGIFTAFTVYVGFSLLWGINPYQEFALLATGAIVVMGLSQIIAPALDSDGYLITSVKAAMLTVMVAGLFFVLERTFHFLLHSQLPELSTPDSMTAALIMLVLLVFGLTVISQIIAPVIKHNVIWQNLGVHFRNGLYTNALFDRLVGAPNMEYQSDKQIRNFS